MAESFVFHDAFLSALPEERKNEFILYTVNYGLYGIEPALTDMSLAYWNTIKARIEADKEQYNKKLEYQKRYQEQKKLSKLSNISKLSKLSNIENVENISKLSNIYPNSRHEFEFDTEFEFDSEFDIDIEFDTDAKLTPPQSQYCKLIFEMWKGASLPGSKDEFSFRSKEFYQSIKSLKGLHSKDVIQAIKNYISVLNDKNCYLKKKYCFDSFVASKVFKEMLPDRFVKENFRKFNSQATISNDSDTSDYSFAKVSANGK